MSYNYGATQNNESGLTQPGDSQQLTFQGDFYDPSQTQQSQTEYNDFTYSQTQNYTQTQRDDQTQDINNKNSLLDRNYDNELEQGQGDNNGRILDDMQK